MVCVFGFCGFLLILFVFMGYVGFGGVWWVVFILAGLWILFGFMVLSGLLVFVGFEGLLVFVGFVGFVSIVNVCRCLWVFVGVCGV